MTGVGPARDLLAAAASRTGLAEFGADDFRDGLDVLVESYAADAALTEAGVRAARAEIRGALMARLRSEAAWQRYPEHAAVDIAAPVIVTGLPRTGTTALHRLLAADPANQGLELWLSQAPQPRPERRAWADDPVYAALDEALRRHRAEHPEFAGVHQLAADQVEECWQLLRQSMRSVSFECLAHLPTYSSWLRGQDWTAAYRRHRRNLQLIGLRAAGRRWVLKNPSHIFALDALLAVYPDAHVVVTHREPRVAIASACSLAAHATAGWSGRFTGAVIGADQLELWARGMEAFLAARARHEPGRFVDVRYDEFTADPVGTIASVYGRCGLALSGQAADAMRALLAGSRGGGAVPAHRYSLADFGLTASQVADRFAAYLPWCR